MDGIQISKATAKDNFEDMAKLVYNTDCYIYPQWFKTIENATPQIAEMIASKNTMFSFKNCIVARDGKRVVGIIVYLVRDVDLSNDYSKWNNSPEMDYVIQNYILPIKKECKENEYVYISNVCVDSNYRGKGIATKMMRYLFDIYKDKDFVLEVLKENSSTVKLYERNGFEIIDEYAGFNGEGLENPPVFKMKKTR